MKLRALTAIVGLAAFGLNADCISYSQDGGTLTFPANYSYVPEGPNDRMVIFEGNVIVDDTVSITATDDGAGSCNFLGVDRGSPATLTVKTGGSITFSTAYGSPGALKLSANSGQMATLNVEGGTVTVGGYIWTCTYWNSDNGSGGRGIVNVNAGTLSVPTFNLGANSDNSGTTEVNLNGGTLAVGKFSFRAYNRQQLKLQGGTLQATGDDIFDLGIGYADSEGRSLEVVGGKTTVFDTNGHNQRLPAELGGTGRLVLTGGGAVSFAGEAPSYGVTFDGVTLALRAGEGTTAPLALNLDAAGMNPVEVEVPAGASGRLPLVRVASATFSGAKLATHFTCASGMLVFADGIIWLDRNGDSRGALVYSGEGGSDTPDPGSYTFLAFANPSGGYVVGGDELVLTDDRAIISAVGDVGQTVMAPVKATSNARVEVEAVGRGELNLAGGLTANEIEKTGDGKVLFGFPTELNKLVLHDGTIDFGGNAFEGKSFELANENGAGRVVTLQNGSWREAPNVVLDYTGYELHFGRDFNFSFKDNGRFAIGYGPQGAVKKQALILDEGCGVVTLYGNSHNYCNFVGVDVDGESSLVLNGGTLHAVREGGDSGCIRIGSGGNSNVSGLVKVAGGNLIVDWDMTLASQYNGFNGGNGSAAFELESGTASIAQLYLGGATAASGKGSIRLTGGELSLKSFCCLPYNEQSLYIDNVTVHALCDDGNRAYKFMEKRGDLDTKPRSYVLGAHGVEIDTAGYAVHLSIPFAGDGQMRVAGGGSLTIGASQTAAGGIVATDTTVGFGCYTTYPSLTLVGTSCLLVDLSNYDGRADVVTFGSALVLPEGKTFAEIASVVNGEGTLELSADGRTIRVAAENSIVMRHVKYGNTEVRGNWRDLIIPPTAEMLLKSDLGFLGNSSVSGDMAWAAEYFAGSHNRVDGWVNVAPEQAGLWKIEVCFDDYIGFALDGDWKVSSEMWNTSQTAEVEVTAGWHQFTITCGDYAGGYGAQDGAPFPNDYPVGVTIGAGEKVKFDTNTFAVGDPVASTEGDFVVDRAGAVQFNSLKFNPACRLVLDPAKSMVRLAQAPTFTAAGQLALVPAYAAATKGRFLLMSWDTGSLKLPEGVSLDALFDAASTAGADPRVTVETVGTVGRLWLDLDAAGAKTKLTLLPLGGFLTMGAANESGTWRTLLARKLCADGFDVKTTGLTDRESFEATGLAAPTAWARHSGIWDEHLRTTGAHAGLDCAVEALLDQAGPGVDAVLLSIGMRDLEEGGDPEVLAATWCDVVARIAAQLPTTKILCSTATDLVTEENNAKVATFNAQIKAAVASGRFPAKQVYIADVNAACPREGKNFYAPGDLRPYWPGEELIAACWATTLKAALADGPIAADAPVETTTQGCEANVPAAYRTGFARARVYDAIAAGVATGHPIGSEVPYEDFAAETGATELITRVGYYIELRRKNTDSVDYGGRVRWLWADMDAFGADPGSFTIADVGVPFNPSVRQQVVSRLHVASNMPGIAPVAADDDTVSGFVEFWPYTYEQEAGPAEGAPDHLFGFDWNDRPTPGGNYGSMQIHRLFDAAARPAQTLFAYNHFTSGDAIPHDFGLGTFAGADLGSMDWTFSGRLDGMNLAAYEVARIEIWTHGLKDEEDSSEVVDATWLGGTSGDPLDPSNWQCVNACGRAVPNAVPGIHTTIHMSSAGAVNLQAPPTCALQFHVVQLEGSSLVLATDCDWRLFGEVRVPDGMTIDLNGHKLSTGMLRVETAGGATVTDQSARGGGELHLVVPEDMTYVNDKVFFTGKMALVKEGPGIFVPSLELQSYTGGTTVADGVLRADKNGDNLQLGPWGATLTVAPDGTFDLDGRTNFTAINLVLAGGTLANTGWGVWESAGLGNVTLTADSKMNKVRDITQWWDGYLLDLGGHTLDIDGGPTQSFLLSSPARNGTVVVRNSWFATFTKTVEAKTVDLKQLEGAKLYLRSDLHVRDYYAATDVQDALGEADLFVYGTFTPAGEWFRGCVLQNGAAIDLSMKTGPWTPASDLILYQSTDPFPKRVVAFADNATIGLKLGSRRFFGTWQYVVEWNGHAPANLATLKFLSPGLAVKADETGIKVARFATTVFIR